MEGKIKERGREGENGGKGDRWGREREEKDKIDMKVEGR